MRRWLWVGATLLLLRLGYLVVEPVVAVEATGYSLVDDSISRLGARACTASACSPARDLMNGTFVVVGLLLAAGALLMRQRLGTVATVLLLVSGASSVATGLTPLDDGARHAVAAAPLFVCQPLALLRLARDLRAGHVGLSRLLLVAAVLTAVGAVAFVAGAAASGLLERVAIWTPLVVLAVAGVVLARDPERMHRTVGR